MKIRFLAQPFRGRGQVGDVLLQAFPRAIRFRAAVAWAQLSGLNQLRASIMALRERGGVADAIVGIDQGIATIEGLKAAMEIFEPIYVFHDRGRRTYHPKLYVIEGRREATVVVGSANITEGGLFEGYEAAVVIELSKRRNADRALLADFIRYFVLLRKCGSSCKKLDKRVLTRIEKNPGLTKSKQREASERRQNERFEKAAAALFGSAVAGLTRAPKQAAVLKARRGAATRRGGGATSPLASPGTKESVLMSWWKLLTPSDVMRKPPGSHERRYVVLSQADKPIDQTTFFRRKLFAGVRWSRKQMRGAPGKPKKTKEITQVPFDAFVGNRYLGKFRMTVDHAPSRVADQGNAPTYLNWSSLTDVIKKRDFRQHYLLLERISHGGFRLTLTRQRPNPPVIP